MKKAGYVTAQAGKWVRCRSAGRMGFRRISGLSRQRQVLARADRFYTQNASGRIYKQGIPADIMHDFVVDFIHAPQGQRSTFIMRCHTSTPLSCARPTARSRWQTRLYATTSRTWTSSLANSSPSLIAFTCARNLDRLHRDNGTARFGADRSTLVAATSTAKKAACSKAQPVPLVVNWPGTTAAGKVNHDLTDFSDFFTTFAELAERNCRQARSLTTQFRGADQRRKGIPVSGFTLNSAANRTCATPLETDQQRRAFRFEGRAIAEIPVPETRPTRSGGRAQRLQEILDQHPAAASAGPGARGENRDSQNKKKQQTPHDLLVAAANHAKSMTCSHDPFPH